MCCALKGKDGGLSYNKVYELPKIGNIVSSQDKCFCNKKVAEKFGNLQLICYLYTVRNDKEFFNTMKQSDLFRDSF